MGLPPPASSPEGRSGAGAPDDLHLDYVAIVVLATILVVVAFVVLGDTVADFVTLVGEGVERAIVGS